MISVTKFQMKNRQYDQYEAKSNMKNKNYETKSNMKNEGDKNRRMRPDGPNGSMSMGRKKVKPIVCVEPMTK